MAELSGGGQLGVDIAARILELRKGLPLGTLGRRPLADQFKLRRSVRIKANPI